METRINIVIPSIQLSDELIFCLTKLNKQDYKNFFVTIVLDFKNKRKLPKLNYKLNILISGAKNMSYKRNLGVKKYKSNIVSFLDSDAYPPKNWLKIANNFLIKKKNKKIIFGGPSIPFPRQTYGEMLCHYAKRSFFVTGYLNFRKFKSKKRTCDWLESCNMFIKRDLYLKHGGMDLNKYLGEDKEFFERIKRDDKSIRVIYTSKLFIYHKERNIMKFLMQRTVFGSDLFNIVKFGNNIRSYQPILPLLVLTIFFLILFLEIDLNIKIILISTYLLFTQFLILLNIQKYLKNINIIVNTLILINLANLVYAIGNIFAITGLKNFFNRKVYLKSRSNK